MANAADHQDAGERAALARLLDPSALEARLVEARARRARALAARAAAPPAPVRPRPSLRAALFLVAGLAAAAVGGLLASQLRRESAPEVALTVAVPAQPAALPAVAPASPAGWRETTPSPPRLAALVLSPLALPPPRPLRPARAPSRARASPVAETGPVLARAAAAAVLSAISRSSSAVARLPFPLVQDDRDAPRQAAPKLVRRAEGLVRQLAGTGRSAVKAAAPGGGEGVARSIRRAAALQGNARRDGHAARQGHGKDGHGKGGSAGHGDRGGGKGHGGGKGGRR